MTPEQRIENSRTLANSLAAYGVTQAGRRVAAILHAPAGAWTLWTVRQPVAADGEIVGMDRLGFLHGATHLADSRDPMWVERWIRVPG